VQTYDVAVIGGGIVGLGSAMALLRGTDELDRTIDSLVVLEAEPRLAAHQSGRNSGVIHSGLYYKPGSLKATLCAEGRELMYDFCAERGIAHERCGKIVLATREDGLARLRVLEERGTANGLTGLRRLSREEIREFEPHARGVGALHVPQTGIVDFAAVTRAFADVVAELGGEVRTAAPVRRVVRERNGFTIQAGGETLRTAHILNCAGAQCDRIAELCGVRPDVRIIPFRGEYFELVPERADLIRNLIYPVPDPRLPFLGVHFTRLIGGGVEAGPNAVLALSRSRYRKTSVDARDLLDTLAWPGFWRMAGKNLGAGVAEFHRSLRKRAFTRSLQRLVPDVRESDLRPGHAGIRAQAVDRRGRLIDDFHIIRAERQVHVLNAPSPAATASLAIGRRIAEIAAKAWMG